MEKHNCRPTAVPGNTYSELCDYDCRDASRGILFPCCKAVGITCIPCPLLFNCNESIFMNELIYQMSHLTV